MAQGYVSLILHAHLPYVKHPEYEEFLEEDWFFEAVAETYLPLIDMMHGLIRDGVPFAINIVISPTLAAMMEDQHHINRFIRYLDKSIELSSREVRRLCGDAEFEPIARFYFERLTYLKDLYVNRLGCDLISAFRDLMETGRVEIMTCAATHGLLPVLSVHPESVKAQVKIGCLEYERHFRRRPIGIWLPECGYKEGIDEFLADEDLRYFIVDTHCLQFAQPMPIYGVYAPVFCPSGVLAFGRDAESSKQVWSAKEGYPGDAYYREFYRDVGYDLPFEYVREFIQPTGYRKSTGLKYYRITGDVDLSEKKPYIRSVALERAAEHAGNFMFNRERQIEYLSGVFKKPPIVVAPYDAELFGHWWFEGPDFLGFLFRKAAYDQKVFEFITLSDYIRRFPTHQVAYPATGTWGDKGYFHVWVNGSNDYIYKHLFHCADVMKKLVLDYPDAKGLTLRALNQCLRELLLAQSSDWPFIMTTGTMTEYAHRRVREHVLRFNRLAEQIRTGCIDERWLTTLEFREGLFPNIDYRTFKI